MAEEIKFKREYYLHRFTQKHLKELFQLKCVASEIQHKKLRFDNLAFDKEKNSFVIIEYKNRFSKNVLKQAQDYYDLVQEDQGYFINLLDKNDYVNVDNTKIMIIGPKFDQEQIDNAKPNVELWKVNLFDDGKITYKNLKNHKTKTSKVEPEDLTITEDELLENRSEEMKYLFKSLKNSIKNEFNDVEINYLVNQFSFRTNDSLICIVEFLKSSFNIYIFADRLINANKTIDISEKSTGGKAKYKLKYESDDDLNYLLDLFKQTYNQKK